MRKMILQLGTVLALSLLAANVMAAVSPEEANKLGTKQHYNSRLAQYGRTRV